MPLFTYDTARCTPSKYPFLPSWMTSWSIRTKCLFAKLLLRASLPLNPWTLGSHRLSRHRTVLNSPSAEHAWPQTKSSSDLPPHDPPPPPTHCPKPWPLEPCLHFPVKEHCLGPNPWDTWSHGGSYLPPALMPSPLQQYFFQRKYLLS